MYGSNMKTKNDEDNAWKTAVKSYFDTGMFFIATVTITIIIIKWVAMVFHVSAASGVVYVTLLMMPLQTVCLLVYNSLFFAQF